MSPRDDNDISSSPPVFRLYQSAWQRAFRKKKKKNENAPKLERRDRGNETDAARRPREDYRNANARTRERARILHSHFNRASDI